MRIIDPSQLENIKATTTTAQEAIGVWNAYCNDVLNSFNPNDVNTAIGILEARKAKLTHRPIADVELEENKETDKLFELLSDFSEGIKTLYTHFDGILTHCTSEPPSKIQNTIKISENILQYYRTERGNWVFAASIPVDGSNPFAIRKRGEGLVKIAPDIYVLGENHIQVIKNENGESRAVLDNPQYVYKFKPTNFTPTVNLERNQVGHPSFLFHGEWTSTQNIDLTDKSIYLGMYEIVDVTEAVKKHQIFTTAQPPESIHNIVTSKLSNAHTTKTQYWKILADAYNQNKVRYINRRNGS